MRCRCACPIACWAAHMIGLHHSQGCSGSALSRGLPNKPCSDRIGSASIVGFAQRPRCSAAVCAPSPCFLSCAILQLPHDIMQGCSRDMKPSCNARPSWSKSLRRAKEQSHWGGLRTCRKGFNTGSPSRRMAAKLFARSCTAVDLLTKCTLSHIWRPQSTL